MEDKCVLILGAGLMQRPAIEAAQELGYKTVVADANPNALCAGFADRFENIDLKDKEGLAKLALSLGDSLEGVFTAGTDFSASVSYVAQKCGLHAHSYQAACNASNKVLMRECFQKAGVPSPKFQQIHRTQIASFIKPSVLSQMSFPMVVKPVDNMGARGCRLVRNQDEFLPCIEDAVRNSRSGNSIFEEYMEGPEYSIDAIVYKDTVTITGFADRHIFYSPYFIEMGHTMPTAIDDEKKNELIKTFARAIKALGLSCGVAKADIKYTAQGPMVGEIAGRLSGGYMSGWTYPYASDLNLTKQALLVALGKEPQELLLKRRPLPISDGGFELYEVPCQNFSAERAWISIPGTVSRIYGTEQCASHPFVKNALFRAELGSSVDFPRNNVEKCGNCISRASKRDLAVNSAEKAVSNLVLRLEPNSTRTDSFLSGNSRSSEKGFPPDAYQLTKGQREAFDFWLSEAGIIKASESIEKNIPLCFKESADNLKDWNHRSIRMTAQLFDSICPNHPDLDKNVFWKALIRGGIQGILYVADSSL
ncbi:MAG: ATP-grasp domain-containing protein [Treponema sp.]|nr:ATP-grasp domain-containing protein [Treponema sp.]